MRKKLEDKEIIEKVKEYCKNALGSKAVGMIYDTEYFYQVELLFEKPTAHTKVVSVHKTEIGAME